MRQSVKFRSSLLKSFWSVIVHPLVRLDMTSMDHMVFTAGENIKRYSDSIPMYEIRLEFKDPTVGPRRLGCGGRPLIPWRFKGI
jgi:hypothetical protein